jgi:hypothetical protein
MKKHFTKNNYNTSHWSTKISVIEIMCCFLILSGCGGCSYNHESASEGSELQQAKAVQDRKPIQCGPLLFPETLVDIGEEFGNISYSFSLKNTGNQLANNFRLSPSCGCTTVKLNTEQVAPGDEARIELYIDQSTGGQGDHLYSVTVEFKVDNSPFQVVLYLQSHNKAEILWNPNNIYIETYSDDAVVRYIKLVNHRRKNFSIQDIATGSSWITCQQVPESSADNTDTGVTLFEVSVDMSKVHDGVQESTVAFLTNDEEFSHVTFPVVIKKLPQIRGIPDRIILMKLQGDSMFVGKTTIYHCEDKPLTITDVEVTPQSCLKKYSIDHDEQKNSYS